MLLGCLGSTNYWLSLPFLALLGAMSLFALVAPDRMRRFHDDGYSNRVMRLFGAGMLVVLVLFARSALDEARNDPNCEHPGRSGEAAVELVDR